MDTLRNMTKITAADIFLGRLPILYQGGEGGLAVGGTWTTTMTKIPTVDILVGRLPLLQQGEKGGLAAGRM